AAAQRDAAGSAGGHLLRGGALHRQWHHHARRGRADHLPESRRRTPDRSPGPGRAWTSAEYAAARARRLHQPPARAGEAGGASPGLDEQERQLMSVVRSEAERLEALVREFLSFAKPISPAFEALDGSRAMTETVELFRQEVAERGIELVARAGEPVFVRADPGQLRQVLWNLLGNAADATPPGGRVEVRVSR